MSFFARIFGPGGDRDRLLPLYRAVVAAGRDPAWYRDGKVADTLDGRFDMIAALLAMLLLRLEQEGEAARADSALLAELFVEDMEGSLRQIGVGDLMVGKHVGKMMGALGGRLGAFREGFARSDVREPVRRNIFHEAPPSPAALTFVTARIEAFAEGLHGISLDRLLGGELPAR